MIFERRAALRMRSDAGMAISCKSWKGSRLAHA
jgi:hypothetical protein